MGNHTFQGGNEAGNFVIYPESGKKRGQGNGVVPIKEGFLAALNEKGWDTRERNNPERFDAVKPVTDGTYLAVEWETGNISSSHRSINRILLAQMSKHCVGGILVLPTRNLAQYLTDRVGNLEELSKYFPLWEAGSFSEAPLMVIAIEHDGEDRSVKRIPKRTDGRALA